MTKTSCLLGIRPDMLAAVSSSSSSSSGSSPNRNSPESNWPQSLKLQVPNTEALCLGEDFNVTFSPESMIEIFAENKI